MHQAQVFNAIWGLDVYARLPRLLFLETTL